MERFFKGVALVYVCGALAASVVFFGAVHVWSGTAIHGLAGLLLILMALSLLMGWTKLRLTWVDGAVPLFLLVVLISYFRSSNEFVSRQEMLNLFSCAIFYFSVRLLLQRTWHLEGVFGILFLVGTGVAFYAVLQHYDVAEKVLWRESLYPGRASGTYICPNHLAGMLGMVMPIVMSVLLWSHAKPVSRLWLIYGLGVMAAGLLFTFSRGGLLATLGGLSVCILLGMRQKTVALFTVLVGATCAVGVVFLYLHALNPDQCARYLDALAEGEVSRPQMWRSAWQIFLANPIFGVGPMMFDWWHPHYRGHLIARAVHAHNDYLHLLADYGIVGGLAMLALLAGLFYRAWRGAMKFGLLTSTEYSPHALLSSRAAFQRSFFIGVVGAWAAVMLHVLVDFDMHIFANALMLSILLAFMVALSFTSREWGRSSFSTRPWVGWVLAGGCVALLLAGALVIPRNFHGDLLRRQAVTADQALEWDVAERYFQKAVAVDPSNSSAWEEYADFLYKRAQLNIIQRDALVARFDAACEKALKTNPLCVVMRVRRGEILDLQGRYEEAEKEYRAALDFDPKNPFFHNRLGLHYRRRGMAPEAEQHFKQALEYGGSDSVASENLKELKPF